MEIIRIEDDRFEVRIIKMDRAWLLTWNEKNWHWAAYDTLCEMMRPGYPHLESWACASSQPRIGDEVFLIKLGEEPRGIIGHGRVTREQYEKEHYNLDKAAQGKTEKAIDVEFDQLLNYKFDRFILQSELVEKCGAQHWSPQGSGIEIKQEVIPTLHELWKNVTKNETENDYWPSQEEYPVNLSKDDWKRFIREIEMNGHEGCMRVLACFIDIGGIASPKALAEKYKGHSSVYVGSIVNTGRRAVNYFDMTPCPDGGRQRYFPIAFQGHSGKGESKGTYEYRMRPELFEALKEIDLSGINLIYSDSGNRKMSRANFDHNMILYGPPGTGKTYHCAYYAVSICDGRDLDEVKRDTYSNVMARFRELKTEGRIAFTTFHQSYGYEEFIEGIKPKLNIESESLGYTIEDGVFKEFCKRAKAVKIHSNDTFGIKSNPHIWGMLLGGTGFTEIKQYCFENDVIRFDWDNIADTDVIEDNQDASKSEKFAIHQIANFIYSMEVGDLVLVAKNITTIDAIGVITGEYEYDQTKENHCRTRSVRWLVKNVEFDILPYLPNGRKKLPTSYLYPFDYLGIDKVTEILDELHEQSEIYFETETKPYVFIIDEINRGNISKIFGELITLIEETKRAGSPEAMEVILPYSGEAFSVPGNVYILGTMNTADRSIALMDTALRRRFEFVEMMPDSEVLESQGAGTICVDNVELNVAKMLDLINERIEYLFDREHTIGHAFFRKLEDDPSIDTLADIFEKKVIPLLQEYFYEDYEKIQLVLGDNDKEDEFKFVLDKKVELGKIFKGNPDMDLPSKRYSIQKSAFKKIQSYKLIGRDL